MLEVKDLSFYYCDGDFGLRDINFTLPRGQIVGLLGDNGAGKTTLIRCMTGLYSSFRGTVTIDEKSGEQIRAKIAYISGQGAVFGTYTPAQMGEMLGEHYPLFDTERYAKMIEYFELPYYPIRQMSKGERAKAELAAGVCKGTDYILMDEPFANKDVFTRRDFLKILAGGLRDNETILLSTHLVEEVEHFIDRALVLNKGKLAADITLDELREEGSSLIALLSETMEYDEKRASSLFS